jgi:hypothetical protein
VLVAQGNLPEALESFRDGFALRVAGEGQSQQRDWQRGFRVSYDKIGPVLVARQPVGGAETSSATAPPFRASWQSADPTNAGLAADLSISYNKIGPVRSSDAGIAISFRDGLAIRERLAKADPSNVRWRN